MTFKEAWDRAGQPADDFDPPNGTYEIEITDAGAFAGRDGREWGKAHLKITQGEHQGREFDDFMNFNNEVGFRIARQNLHMYGLSSDPIEDLEDLDTRMVELIGTKATVSVKHSTQGHLNVTVTQGRTAPSDIPGQETFETTPQTVPADNSDIPF